MSLRIWVEPNLSKCFILCNSCRVTEKVFLLYKLILYFKLAYIEETSVECVCVYGVCVRVWVSVSVCVLTFFSLSGVVKFYLSGKCRFFSSVQFCQLWFEKKEKERQKEKERERKKERFFSSPSIYRWLNEKRKSQKWQITKKSCPRHLQKKTLDGVH